MIHLSIFKIQNKPRWLLLLAILAAFALRLYRLGSDSLWYDETVSVELARKSISGLLAHTAGDIHPPGYYLLLHGWQQLTNPQVFAATNGALPSSGPLEFLYAWPSFCFGILLVALLFAIGRRLFSTSVGLLAAWLAVINPYQIWYSQEVRMYTLIASLGLICLYMLIKWLDQPRTKHPLLIYPLIIYTLSAAAGLYIHYYLLFGLIALNFIALWLIVWQPSARGKRLIYWIGTQLAVLILWLPWLPIFWRQATDPPVPPWREPWTLHTFGTALYESIASLFIGQSLPDNHPSQRWIWMIFFIIMSLAFLIVQSKSRRARQPRNPNAWLIVLSYIFIPMLILYGVTASGTPIYHVRYLFLFAPLFLVIIAQGLLAIWQQSRALFIVILASLLILNAAALEQFWQKPIYRADDHRRATAELAANWRPGDLILVNAGWTYTALHTYWPTAINTAHNSLPNQPQLRQRLDDYASQTAIRPEQPQIIYSGTIDGDANLGWGSPDSDFYALSQAEMSAALSNLAEQYARIWHYRLYDTNSDPPGSIRAWLDQNAAQLDDQLFAGPASLRIQLFDTGLANQSGEQRQRPIKIEFSDLLRFDYAQFSDKIEAGRILYISTEWTPLPELESMPTDLRFSLRLYAQQDSLVAQRDQSPLPPTSSWLNQDRDNQNRDDHSRDDQNRDDHSGVRQALALPIPAGVPPGVYSLELVVYRADTGEALALPELSARELTQTELPETQTDLREKAPSHIAKSIDGTEPLIGETIRTIYGQRLHIGSVTVEPMTIPFYPATRVATFDYIDLLTADVAYADRAINTQLTWQPRVNSYTDTYTAIFELRSAFDGEILQTWHNPAGGSTYPSGEWIAEAPVNEERTLPLDPQIGAGEYRLTLRLARASDGRPIDARIHWLTQDVIDFAAIVVD